MKKISLQKFKHIIRDIHKNTERRKFCFVVGAGASFKSGIPTGGQLAQNWFNELNDRYDTTEIQGWIEDIGLDRSDLAAHYGAIYRKRFENDKTSGYEFLVQAMRDAKPTFGHFVLAQILSKTEGNCVLTTNFDSLIESAIYQFTDRTPLVCGHESLSGYARPSKIHPLIVKIHRDLLLSPKSDLNEISQLDIGWVKPLDNIFSSHIPIVMGYGGNDGSLMAYFEDMKKPSNFFWCVHQGSIVSNRVQELVGKMDGSFIEIAGFDEMMKELLWVFDEIKPVKEELDAVTKTRIEFMTEQLYELDLKPGASGFQTTSEKELSAFEYSAKADNEPNFEKRKEIYLEGVDKFPKTDWLWAKLIYFLHYEKKDYENLEEYYLKLLSINPDDAFYNVNYAIFLMEVKKRYEDAEKYFLKALAIDPENVVILGNYANFVKDIKKEYEVAEKLYLKALSLDPDNALNNGNYAIFLTNGKRDFEVAEKYFLKALACDPENANLNGSYALYLTKVKKLYERAEKYYLKALSLDPDNALNNGNYAVFLHEVKNDFNEAEIHYLKALAIDPERASYNGNYANLLMHLKKDLDKAEKHYLKALEIDTEHAVNNGNYALFLTEVRSDTDKAEKHYLKALEIDPEHVNNVGNYAEFLSSVKKDFNRAGKYFLKALEIDPKHANNNGNYAGYLLVANRKEQAKKYLENAIKLNGSKKTDLLVELWFYRYAHYPEWHQESERMLDSLIQEGITSLGWNLENNLEVAISNGHPNPEKLKEFTRAITQKNTG